ncbi:hypothetical protein GCM10009789_17590 [Kribbella sancticallisti]|uniref:Uncharacterized protein n=1 Tax=Kribbella sancticallisti TaxID=460087 RepID=A0ABP4NTE5_9ACTN
MEDLQDLGAELHRLAGTDPLAPIDSSALLARGRRSRRKRRLFSFGAVVTGIAAVAIAAALLPNVGIANDRPDVADTPATDQSAQLFSPVPGIPRGEEGAGQQLTMAEVSRRCELRYPGIRRTLPKGQWSSGDTAPYVLRTGDRFLACTIPGGDKPSEKLVAAARRDPLPAGTTEQLRNCSIVFWTDLTKWRVVASATAAGESVNLVAVSPSGRKVVACELGPTFGDHAAPLGLGPRIDTIDGFVRQAPEALVRGGAICPGVPCRGAWYHGMGRVAPNIARIRIDPDGDGPVHDVKVTDGWFALSWLNTEATQHADGSIISYDEAGNVLATVAL